MEKAIVEEDISEEVRRKKEFALVSIKNDKTQSIKGSISFDQKNEFNVEEAKGLALKLPGIGNRKWTFINTNHKTGE